MSHWGTSSDQSLVLKPTTSVTRSDLARFEMKMQGFQISVYSSALTWKTFRKRTSEDNIQVFREASDGILTASGNKLTSVTLSTHSNSALQGRRDSNLTQNISHYTTQKTVNRELPEGRTTSISQLTPYIVQLFALDQVAP